MGAKSKSITITNPPIVSFFERSMAGDLYCHVIVCSPAGTKTARKTLLAAKAGEDSPSTVTCH